MATRNPANEIEFGVLVHDVTDTLGFGATVAPYVISGAVGADTEVSPSEDMEKLVEAIQMRGTWVGLSAYDAGEFTIYVENSSWEDAAAVQVAVQAIGGVFAAATVA